MSTEPTNVYRIQVYDLLSLVQEVTKAAKAGYKIDTKTIPNFPQQIGHIFTLGMIPDDDSLEQTTEVVKQELQKAVEAPVTQSEGVVSPGVKEEATEAPKQTETKTQDDVTPKVNKPGRPAKGK